MGAEREACGLDATPVKNKGTRSRLTFGQGRYTDPIWTYDGRIIYAGTDDPDSVRNLHWTRADGTGVPERLDDEHSRSAASFDHAEAES